MQSLVQSGTLGGDILAIISNWKMPVDWKHRWWSECQSWGHCIDWWEDRGKGIKPEKYFFLLNLLWFTLKCKCFEIKRKHLKFICQKYYKGKLIKMIYLYDFFNMNPFKFQISTFHSVSGQENSRLRVVCGLEKLLPAHLSWQTTVFLFCCWNFKKQ